MASNFTSLTVTWYDNSDAYSTSADITSDVKAIPLFTDTGTGEVNQLQLVLIARDGEYITIGSVIIEQYDRIRVQVTDQDTNTYDRYFEVLDIIPSQSKSEGTLLTIEALGIEYHTQQIHYSGSHYFDHAFSIGEDIGDVYNANAGTSQPQISLHDTAYNTSTKVGNDLPKFTNNHYDYGLFEDTCYNRWMDLIDKLGASVSAGGVLDFYELSFKTTGVNTMSLRLFSSGALPASPITVKNTDSINVSESEGGISAATGTNIVAWGSPDHGSLPVEKSKYTSFEQEFLQRPQWRSGLEYKNGSKVIHNGKHYVSIADDNNQTPGNPSWWTQIDMSTEFGDTLQYSPWTDDKAALWAISGTNADNAVPIVSPTHDWATSTSYTKYDVVVESSLQYLCLKDHTSGTFATDLSAGKWEEVENAYYGNDAAGMFDSNLCMWYKDNRISTWAHRTVNSDANITSLVTDYGYTGTGGIANLPLGTRIKVNSTPTGVLNATDPKTGVTYSNSITEVQEDEDGNHVWVVKYKMGSGTDNFICRVIDDHTSHLYDHGTGLWTEITLSDLGNDTFHLYKTICNVDGIDDKPNVTDGTTYPEVCGTDNTKFLKNIKSAVKVCYNAGNSWVNRATSHVNYLKTGCWINFTFPFPVTTHLGIGEDIGALWGGVAARQAPVFDFENMKYTHTGKRGFNETDSIDLGNISAIAFAMKMEIDVPLLGVVDGLANIRCTLYDINDNVVTQDFELNYTDDTWHNIVLPKGGFSDWRAIKPRYVALNNIAELLRPKEVGAENLFEWRNVKMISLQLQNSYDDFGRYAPEGGDDVTNTTLQKNFGGNISMTIDAFHFKKPLLVSSNDGTAQTVRSLEPTFMNEPHIILFNQLLNVAKTQLEIEQFRHQEYNLTTSGTSIFDIDFGDSFYLEKSDFVFLPVGDRVAGEGANKIKLVAKRIEYHLTKPQTGTGGLTRTIKGVKRFY